MTKKESTLANFLQRMMLLTVWGILVIFLFNMPWKSYVLVRSIFFLLVVLMGLEIHHILPPQQRPRYLITSLLFTSLIPAYTLLGSYFDISFIPLVPLILFLFFSYCVYSLLFEKTISITIIKNLLFLLIYPGFLSSFWLDMVSMEHTTLHYFALVGAVFTSDGFGYFFGMAFGTLEKKRRTTPLFTISPSKTLTGYVGGWVGAILALSIVFIISPEFFDNSFPKMLLLGSLVAIVGNIGDLIESALKRHYKVKDSGSLMPGRGGVLDTLDSLLFATPFYMILYNFLF